MPDAPINATEVALGLANLARKLDTTVKALESADKAAVEKRHEADLAYSHAFLQAQGSVDARKHQAVISTAALVKDSDVADAVVRHLRRELDAIKTRIDVGRSYGAAVRSEIALGQMGMDT